KQKQKSALAFVDAKTGAIEPRSVMPDLSERGLATLRDRLLSLFVNQFLRGRVHGDPHEGNFFILPDGKTIGLMDFGLALDLDLRRTRGTLRVRPGRLVEEPKRRAEALCARAATPPAATDKERRAIREKLETECEALVEEMKAVAERTSRALQDQSQTKSWF